MGNVGTISGARQRRKSYPRTQARADRRQLWKCDVDSFPNISLDVVGILGNLYINYSEAVMAKIIKCLDVGVACDFEARAENEAELMKKVAEHARTAHGITQIPAELVAKVKAAIRDVK
jgi:predicted small metal-binding protein